MRYLRIKGMVSQANSIRQQLHMPMTIAQRDRLASHLNNTIRQVDAILQQYNSTIDLLPAPSRRAYRFLKSVDLNLVKLSSQPPNYPGLTVSPSRDQSVSFRGLRACFDGLLDDIAGSLYIERFDAEGTHRMICQTAQRLDSTMTVNRYEARHLKTQSRELLGWFRYFADAGNFNDYANAVRRARYAFARIGPAKTRWPSPLLIHFRPTAAMYRWQLVRKGTRIIMPTPMIAFDEQTLQQVGLHMLSDKRHMPVIRQATLDQGYQAVAATLEKLAGPVEQTQGLYHDLAVVFDRVKAEYFNGLMDRPKLTWSKTLTGRIFGHYEFVSDTVMTSRTLDTPDTPAYVLDHVMHHELLHKKLGLTYSSTRQHAHTKLFRQHERTFKYYHQAVNFLNNLVFSRT